MEFGHLISFFIKNLIKFNEFLMKSQIPLKFHQIDFDWELATRYPKSGLSEKILNDINFEPK